MYIPEVIEEDLLEEFEDLISEQDYEEDDYGDVDLIDEF